LEAKCGADSLRHLCPDGWHVPTDAEWTQLTNYLGAQPKYICDNNATYIAKSMASKQNWQGGWSNCHVGSYSSLNNATWFTAYPSGYWNQSNNTYNSYGAYAGFWSSTPEGSNNQWLREFYYSSSNVTRLSNGLWSYSYTVRCLKND